jgi:hypothetical protein
MVMTVTRGWLYCTAVPVVFTATTAITMKVDTPALSHLMMMRSSEFFADVRNNSFRTYICDMCANCYSASLYVHAIAVVTTVTAVMTVTIAVPSWTLVMV